MIKWIYFAMNTAKPISAHFHIFDMAVNSAVVKTKKLQFLEDVSNTSTENDQIYFYELIKSAILR